MKTGRGTKKLAACLLAGCLLAGGTAGGASADDEYEDFLNGYGDDWFEEEYSDEYPEERYEEGYSGELSGDSGDEVIYFDEEIPYDEANAVTCSDDSLFAKAVPELSTTLPAGTVLKVRRLTGDLGGISATSAITRLNEQKPEYLSPYDEDNTLLFDVEFLRHRTDEEGNWVVRGEGEPESDLDYTADGVTYRMEEVWPDGYVDVSVTFYDMDPAVEVSFTTDKPGVAAMHDGIGIRSPEPFKRTPEVFQRKPPAPAHAVVIGADMRIAHRAEDEIRLLLRLPAGGSREKAARQRQKPQRGQTALRKLPPRHLHHATSLALRCTFSHTDKPEYGKIHTMQTLERTFTIDRDLARRADRKLHRYGMSLDDALAKTLVFVVSTRGNPWGETVRPMPSVIEFDTQGEHFVADVTREGNRYLAEVRGHPECFTEGGNEAELRQYLVEVTDGMLFGLGEKVSR